MKVTRFCSLAEFSKYIGGETLTNNTDHYQGGKGGSVSTGFCFSPDEPKTAWRYLKGIVNPEACMLLEISEELLTPSFGKYADYSKGHSGEISCIKTEYCLTEYSQKLPDSSSSSLPKNLQAARRKLPPQNYYTQSKHSLNNHATKTPHGLHVLPTMEEIKKRIEHDIKTGQNNTLKQIIITDKDNKLIEKAKRLSEQNK